MGRVSSLQLPGISPGYGEEHPASVFNPAEADNKHLAPSENSSQKFSVKEGVYVFLFVLLPATPGRWQNLVEEVFVNLYQEFNEMGDSALL